jgi:hypothetical protein
MRRPGKPRSLAGAGGFRESASSPPGGWLDVAWGWTRLLTLAG